jgi:hypothetical protein
MLDQAVNDMREDVTKMRQAAAQVSGLISDSWNHFRHGQSSVSMCWCMPLLFYCCMCTLLGIRL